MNILCIYPGMTKERNDNAFMLEHLRDQGAKLSIITSRSLNLKGTGQMSSYENMEGIPIYRFYRNPSEIFLCPQRNFRKVMDVTQILKPDILFCSQERNIRLGLMIQKHLHIPIILLVEDAGKIVSGKAYGSLATRFKAQILRVFSRTNISSWQWLCHQASALITCHPRDQKTLNRLSGFGRPIFFLPWPTHVPSNLSLPSVRERFRGIYVGSLYPFKNTREFEWSLPLILKSTPTREFIIVGPGPHAKIIRKLVERSKNRIKYIAQLPRIEALKMIASSYYAYTPVKTGGWGFIGDCWSMRTPIVMSHNDDYVTNDVNAVVSKDESSLIDSINRLYGEPELHKTLQDNGFKEYEKRKAERLSHTLYCIFKRVLEDTGSSELQKTSTM